MSDQINELEASELSGVTPLTLNRFAEAGYLRTDEQPDGTKRFSRSEIERVFSLSLEPEASDRNFEASDKANDPYDDSSENFDDAYQQPTVVKEITLKGAEPREEVHNREDEKEIARLTSVVQLQEKYIDLKEQELKNLREERDWLRGRIEKLEEKSDRDQLILVSISETNRGLIKAIENKKSVVKSALEWVGLLPSPSDTSKS